MAIYKELDIMMSYENPGFEFAKTKNPRLQTWDGRVRLFDKKTFPVGLLKMVTGLLDKKNENIVISIRSSSTIKHFTISILYIS
jgi:hypothetical protein